MENDERANTATEKWWEELDHYKKERWCCNTLKEGAFEEHLRLEFDFILPVKFGVNYCCQCGGPIKDGYEKNAEEKEDWCCRLMNTLGFEWLEFEGSGKEIYTMRVNHCFNCGRALKERAQAKKIKEFRDKERN